MSATSVHFSSATAEWYTPPALIARVVKVMGAIDLDPCSDGPGSAVPARVRYTVADDGLVLPWRGRLFLNPPYGDEIKWWIQRLVDSYEAGAVTEAIALVPGRIDTAWYRLLRPYLHCHIAGRLRFGGAQHSAPFPSVVVYLGTNGQGFIREFHELGDVWECISGHLERPRQRWLL